MFGSQSQYAQHFADELRDAGVDPKDAFSQSFNVNDILYWINHTRYGRQATFLVDYLLARQVGLLGIFSDWPATVSYYASYMRLK